MIATLGRSQVTHFLADGNTIVECGAGLGRGTRLNSPVHVITNADEIGVMVTCARCVKILAAAAPAPVEVTEATVTTDEDSNLTADSTVTVGSVTVPVPLTCERGSKIGPLRVAAALAPLGYIKAPGRQGHQSGAHAWSIPIKRRG